MKKLLVGLFTIFICSFAIAHTVEWYVDGNVYQTTTCSSGDNITPPTAPAKYGYSFDGWREPLVRLEYIESSGSQYIDLGIHGKNTTSVHVKYEPLATSTDSGFGIIGQQEYYGDPETFARYIWTNDAYNQFRYSNVQNDLRIQASLNTIYEEEFGNDEWIINGSRKNVHSVSNFTTNDTMALFAVKQADGQIGSKAIIRMYYCTIYQDGVLVQNLIPAKRNRDNVVGMYDTVSGTFFTSAGTGSFIAGPEIGDL